MSGVRQKIDFQNMIYFIWFWKIFDGGQVIQSHLRYLQSHKSQQNKQVNKHEGFSWAHRVNLCHGVGSHVEK